jgi:hypothetical protein
MWKQLLWLKTLVFTILRLSRQLLNCCLQCIGDAGLIVQCCQLAEFLAAKHPSDRIKFCAAGKICGRNFGSFISKKAELFHVCLFIQKV